MNRWVLFRDQVAELLNGFLPMNLISLRHSTLLSFAQHPPRTYQSSGQESRYFLRTNGHPRAKRTANHTVDFGNGNALVLDATKDLLLCSSPLLCALRRVGQADLNILEISCSSSLRCTTVHSVQAMTGAGFINSCGATPSLWAKPRKAGNGLLHKKAGAFLFIENKENKILDWILPPGVKGCWVPRDLEGRPSILPKIADPERLISAARLGSEGPEGNLRATGSQEIVSRQEPRGNPGRPVVAPARVTRLEKPRGELEMRQR